MTSSNSKRGKIEAEFKFSANLKNAIITDKLVPSRHKTGDWLRLLTDVELEELTAIVEQCPEDLNAGDEIFTLVANLISLERGKELITDSIETLVSVFIVMLRLERLRRQGYIELQKTMALEDDEGSFRFTQKGIQLAEQLKSMLD